MGFHCPDWLSWSIHWSSGCRWRFLEQSQDHQGPEVGRAKQAAAYIVMMSRTIINFCFNCSWLSQFIIICNTWPYADKASSLLCNDITSHLLAKTKYFCTRGPLLVMSPRLHSELLCSYMKLPRHITYDYIQSSSFAQISVWAKGKFEGVAPGWLSCNNDGQGGHGPANWIFPNTDCAITESNLNIQLSAFKNYFSIQSHLMS